MRCGRRWGKSTFGEIATGDACTIGKVARRRIGWFTPRFQYLQPVWQNLNQYLAPIIVRSNDSKHIIETVFGTIIECWCLDTNPNAGRGRDYDLAIVDEAGLVPHLRYWMQSALEPTLIARGGRILMLSTSNSIGPDFDDLYEAAERGDMIGWSCATATTFDNPSLPADELALVMAKKIEWPEWLWNREYLGIPPDNASGFFSRKLIKALRVKATEPTRRGSLVCDAETETARSMILQKKQVDKIRWRDDPGGPWRLWWDLEGRPPQHWAWCFGIDLGAGVGAANSVIAAGDAFTRTKWAEYVNPGVTPEELAWQAAAAGLWFGGSHTRAQLTGVAPKRALIQFEINGVGEVFSRWLIRYGYGALCDHLVEPGDIEGATPSDYGWRNSPQSKQTMLAEYRGALATGGYTNPSDAALMECLTYNYNRSGLLVSVNEAADIEVEEARVPHGDRVIADGLLLDAWKRVYVPDPEPELPPRGGIHDRIRQAEEDKRRAKKLVY